MRVVRLRERDRQIRVSLFGEQVIEREIDIVSLYSF